ncbi:hypothetical protein UT300012_22660 [Paraclostridium bifermentans]
MTIGTLLLTAIVVAIMFFNNVTQGTGVASEEVRNLVSNASNDANNILTELSTNPELKKNKEYLSTQLELVIVNQQDYKELEHEDWGEFHDRKKLTRNVLIDSEKILQSYLKGENPKDSLQDLGEEYNTLTE